MRPVFRFAPSPNGALHLGHALSALINFEAAKRTDGRFLLRMEDIDIARCTKDKTDQILDDLDWLGLEWEEPPLFQSERFPLYEEALKTLQSRGLLFPSSASRKEIGTAIAVWQLETGKNWPTDPDGAPLYPRVLLKDKASTGTHGQTAWRLDNARAVALAAPKNASLSWQENGPLAPTYPQTGTIEAKPACWGDVILARKDCPTSYHLSVVMDDAAQGVTHVVRGQDLFAATALQRLLQALLGLPAPLYHHHRLLTDAAGQKLSKSKQDLSLGTLRKEGVSPAQIRAMIKLGDDDLIAFASSES